MSYFRVALEDREKPLFRHYGKLQIRAKRLQEVDCWSGEDTIAQGPKPN